MFGNAGNSATAASKVAPTVSDDFDPRGVDSGANGDFGDFSSAFSSQPVQQAPSNRYFLLESILLNYYSSISHFILFFTETWHFSDTFANFGAVFEASSNPAPRVAAPSQEVSLLDDLLAPASVGPSLAYNSFTPAAFPQGNFESNFF